MNTYRSSLYCLKILWCLIVLCALRPDVSVSQDRGLLDVIPNADSLSADPVLDSLLSNVGQDSLSRFVDRDSLDIACMRELLSTQNQFKTTNDQEEIYNRINESFKGNCKFAGPFVRGAFEEALGDLTDSADVPTDTTGTPDPPVVPPDPPDVPPDSTDVPPDTTAVPNPPPIADNPDFINPSSDDQQPDIPPPVEREPETSEITELEPVNPELVDTRPFEPPAPDVPPDSTGTNLEPASDKSWFCKRRPKVCKIGGPVLAAGVIAWIVWPPPPTGLGTPPDFPTSQ